MKHLYTYLLFFAVIFNCQAQWVKQNSTVTGNMKEILDISVVNKDVVWACVIDSFGLRTNQEVIRTVDGGTTWSKVSITGFLDYNFCNIHAQNKDTAYVSMYDINGTGRIVKTYNGGISWVPVGSLYNGSTESFPNAVYFFDSNNGICLGDPENGYFEIYRTTNGGNNWNRVPKANIPDTTSSTEYGQSAVYCAVNDTIWFGTSDGRVFRSVDKGLNWTVTAVIPGYSIGGIAFKDGMNGLVTTANNNGVYRTTDGGQTFSLVSSSTYNYYYSHATSFKYVKGAGNKKGFYITGGQSGASNTSTYSIDNGDTWIKFDTLFHTSYGFVDANTGWTGATSANFGIGFKLKADIFKLENFNVGMPSYSKQSDIMVFPNPATERLFIETPEAYEVKIYNPLGELVHNYMSNGLNTIDISNLSPGCYFIVFTNNLNTPYTHKLIID